MDTTSAEILYFEKPDGRFYQVSRGADGAMVKLGTAGQPAITIVASHPKLDLAQFVKRATDNLVYFHFVQGTPTAPIIDGPKAEMIWTTQITDDPQYKYVGEEIARLKGEGARAIIHFKNGLTIAGRFDISMFGLPAIADGLIINGPLTVTGPITYGAEYGPVVTAIYGEVRATNLINIDGLLNIHGDVYVDQTVLAEYNDGQLSIFGTLSAEACVAVDQVLYANIYQCHRYGLFSDTEVDWFDPALLIDAEDVDFDAVAMAIRNGQSIVRPDAKFSAD